MKKHVETVHEEKKPFKCEICYKHFFEALPVESIYGGKII
jgi:hypothetical protein